MMLGTEVHGAIEAILGESDTPPVTSDEASEYLKAWAAWWQTTPLGATRWQPEVAFAYDPATDGAVKLETTGRNYSAANDGEIAGTVDAVGLFDGRAVVVDWKTGQDFAGMTADARDNWQLRLYALCVSRYHKVDTVEVVIARITPDGVRDTRYTLDAMELDAVAEEVKVLVEKIEDAKPQPGAHCRRCRAVSVCPSTATAQEALVAAPVALTITADNAGPLLLRLRQVQAACEQVEAALKKYAIENPQGISLGNGKRWVKQTTDRESINLNGADMAAGLAALSGAGVDDCVETKLNVTKAAIERSLKEKRGLKGKELREVMESLLSDLRASGVMRTVSVDSYREVE
jgi:CRISPR/Cas system-associated exonuclease Cas4 (RecB family)